MYVFTHMHVISIKETMNLKESGEKYTGRFGGGKGNCIIILKIKNNFKKSPRAHMNAKLVRQPTCKPIIQESLHQTG